MKRQPDSPPSVGALTAAALLVIVASGGALADGSERAPYEHAAASPFGGLHRHDGLNTSNDEHSIWVFLLPARGTVRLPGYGLLDAGTQADTALGDWTFSCRAPLPGTVESSLEGYAEGRAIQSTLFVRKHPEEPDARTFWENPVRYLLVGMAGRENRLIPVRLQVGNRPGEAREFIMPAQTYSFPRPDHSVEFSPPAAVAAARQVAQRDTAVPVLVGGDDIDIALEFHPTDVQRRALHLMLEHCPAGSVVAAPE